MILLGLTRGGGHTNNSFIIPQNTLKTYTANTYHKILKYLPDTISRTAYCFQHIQVPYYNHKGNLVFNHLHSDHWAMFLYLLSNTIYKVDNDEVLASRVFLLNKALHGVDAFYAVELPSIFCFVHPVGTVIGRAIYKDYFMILQRCSVGSTGVGEYVEFNGENVMFSQSTVIGKCKIGKNVVFSANSFMISGDIPNNSVLLGEYPNHKIIRNRKNVIDRVFR